MNGRCRPSPHRGHYWVEDIPESDRWKCRWCGRIRHFNRERLEKAQATMNALGTTEPLPRQWLTRQTEERRLGRVGTASIESDLNIYSSPSAS